MKSYEEKTVEELKKMASKKKIEGRSKMNKAALVRALKKSSKSKKMRGGNNVFSGQDLESLKNRDLKKNPLFYFESLDFGTGPPRQFIAGWVSNIKNNGPNDVIITLVNGQQLNISVGSDISLLKTQSFISRNDERLFDYLIRSYDNLMTRVSSLPNPFNSPP
jgi:hypothetical protein